MDNKPNNTPGYTGQASLYNTNGRYHASQVSTVASQRVIPQLKCPCPPGLLSKAARMCRYPERGGGWCGILDQCLDCYDV